MSASQLPIRLHGVVDLQQLGLSANSFRFGFLTLESEKYICIREEAPDGTAQVVVVELQNNNNVVRRPMKAEAAIMNPQNNIIALKAKNDSGTGHFVQVYNLDARQKLKVHDFPEQIVYWRWLTAAKLAIVTNRTVYHWNMDGADVPIRIFDRSGPLAEANSQVINYATDQGEKWCLLTAISTPDGGKTINGHMQLFFIEAQQQQILEGHAGCFGEIPLHDGQPPVTAFCFAEKKVNEATSRIHVMEINRPASGIKFKATTELSYTADFPNDFPVAMHLLSRYGVVAMITKFGYLYLFETVSANLIYRTRICEDTIFVTCKNFRHDTVLGVNRRGQVIGISIEEANLIPFINNMCRHIPDATSVSFRIAQRYKLGGAEELFIQQFNRLLSQGDIKGAAKVAFDAPSTLLRNPETINKLRMLPQQPGQPHPMLAYFSTLLELGKLNKFESLELAKPLLQQGRKQVLENWINQNKIECSEELGDLVKDQDPRLALEIYKQSANPHKVLVGMIETGQYDQMRAYCTQNNIQPDFMSMIRSLVATNPDSAVKIAKQAGRNLDINNVTDLFLSYNNLPAATAYLLEVLKDDRAEDSILQTKLLEMNIRQHPQAAETIFQMEMFSHFDKVKIAQLCEQQGLYQRALENYRDINDIRRVLLNSQAINPDYLIAFFGHMTPNNALQCLHDMMKSNRQANLAIVVQIATKYHTQLTDQSLISMFEDYASFDGLFFFLGTILKDTEDKDVYFKYIEAAAKLNQSKEIERVVKETDNYDPVQVKEFLKKIRLPDPRPLIYLCDKHGYGEELTRYLYKSNLTKYIEVYLIKLNPKAAPIVLGTLLDMDCDENYIKQILNTLRSSCPIEQLTEEMEKRNKLRVIQGWLEDREKEGSQNSALHTALAKIYIDLNRDPENFLIHNRFYDSKVVGKYCETRGDPHLAVTAYKRAWGDCDEELIEVTNKNSLYRVQARYLVERQNLDLWAKVLSSENKHKRDVIDQVVAFALPESKVAEEVSCTVKAFLKAELHMELIELLEKIVLHNSDFSNNRNLQNLLILTAIKSDPGRVVDYITRLDNYDAPELAKIALDQYGLAEEAFMIYKKAGMNEDAVDVLIHNLVNIERAQEFADRINSPEVFSKLAKALLDDDRVEAAIDAYIKAQDTTHYADVIFKSRQFGTYKKLITFLLLARKQQMHHKDSAVDSELIYAYAKCDMIGELEDFVNSSNQADVGMVGDRCYDDKLYEAARILFTKISNWAKLASCLVKLKRYTEALEAAKKANSPKTWKEVNFACVTAREFRLAALAGINIIIHPDHLEEVIKHYEKYAYIDELFSLLETGMAHDRAHMGIFTELGVLYAKYRPEKLMDHIRNYYQKLNIPKLLRSCERFRMWPEAVFLYIKYDEYDNALQCMMEHSPSAWNHELFTNVIQKATKPDIYFTSISFYLEEQPMLLNDLLKCISAKIDHAKAVQVMRRHGHLSLILPWLQSVQMYNVPAVNEAVNEILVEMEDIDSLRQSVTEFESFDQLSLAQKIERHPLLEMRRIGAYLYRVNQRYAQALAISKKDEVFQDAMETAQLSKNSDLVEELLRYFLDIKDKEAFCACTYNCYDSMRPDVVMELAWRAGWFDFAMPYFIQVIKDMNGRITALEKKAEAKEKKEEEQAELQIHAPLETVDALSMVMPGLNSLPALPGIPTMATMPPGTYMDPMATMMMTRQFGF